MITGGCSCGRIRYEDHGTPFDATICHCSDCRRVAAAPAVAWFSVAAPDLRFVAGQPKRFLSSSRAVRSFCPDCGTPLTFQANATAETIDVTLGSLDDAESIRRDEHMRTGERLSWVHLSDGLRSYPTTRSAG